MTPLNKIESGILTGNWGLVCEGFNKLTGKNLTPPEPIVATLEETFSPEKANKKELYAWMKEKIDVGPIKSYTTAELREMVAVHMMTEEFVEAPVFEDTYRAQAKSEPFKNGGKILDGFRYTSGKKELLPIDRVKVKAIIEPQLKNVGDPTADYTPRDAPEKVKIKCMKCSKQFQTYKGIGVEVDNELKALCPICSESL